MTVTRRRLLRSTMYAGAGLVLVPAFTSGCELFEEPAAVKPPTDATGRIYQVDGAFNVRDLGGYPSAGKTVATGRLFRSSSLNRLTEKGIGQIAGLGVSTVVDFRGTVEKTNKADRLPSGVTTHSAPVTGEAIPAGLATAAAVAVGPPIGLTSADESTMDEFRTYATSEATRASYGGALRILADSADKPFLWHCNSGTYRTGWASAVLLTLLGVPQQTVYDDFLLSNAAFGGATYAFPEYLDAAFEAVNAKYGSFAAYVRDGLGVDSVVQAKLTGALLT